MDKKAFTLLHGLETTWWYRGRAYTVSCLLEQNVRKQGAVLDLGAGFGGMHTTLARYGAVAAFEPEVEASAVAAGRGYKRVYPTLEDALAKKYDLIGVSHHHFRRYSKGLLNQKLQEAGFEVVSMSYWNKLLFIPAACMRLLGSSGEGGLDFSRPINEFLYFIIRTERFLPLPFGLSLVALARKK